MTSLLNSRLGKTIAVVMIVMLTCISVNHFGYYDGVMILLPISLICILYGLIYQNAFCCWFALYLIIANIILSLISIPQPPPGKVPPV